MCRIHHTLYSVCWDFFFSLMSERISGNAHMYDDSYIQLIHSWFQFWVLAIGDCRSQYILVLQSWKHATCTYVAFSCDIMLYYINGELFTFCCFLLLFLFYFSFNCCYLLKSKTSQTELPILPLDSFRLKWKMQ